MYNLCIVKLFIKKKLFIEIKKKQMNDKNLANFNKKIIPKRSLTFW